MGKPAGVEAAGLAVAKDMIGLIDPRAEEEEAGDRLEEEMIKSFSAKREEAERETG